jgi:hypothetical protein
VLLRLARVRPLACGLARPGQPRMWRLWNTGTKDLGQGPPGPPSNQCRSQPPLGVAVSPLWWWIHFYPICVELYCPRKFPVYGHRLRESLQAKERDTELLQDLASGGGRNWGACDGQWLQTGLSVGSEAQLELPVAHDLGIDRLVKHASLGLVAALEDPVFRHVGRHEKYKRENGRRLPMHFGVC